MGVDLGGEGGSSSGCRGGCGVGLLILYTSKCSQNVYVPCSVLTHQRSLSLFSFHPGVRCVQDVLHMCTIL